MDVNLLYAIYLRRKHCVSGQPGHFFVYILDSLQFAQHVVRSEIARISPRDQELNGVLGWLK